MTCALRRRLLSIFAVAAFGAVPSVQAADTWPSHPITIVSPYAPGGTTDILARLLAKELTGPLGQNIIVENRAGAGGNIGTDYVARAKPDGYTFLLAASGPIVIAGTLYTHLSYNPATDFTAIAPLANTSFVVVANAKTDLKSIQDVVREGKEGKIAFGSAGSGTPQHIIGEMFNTAAGIKIQHIPYKGSGPLLTDIVGGQVQLAFENPLVMLPQIKSGALRALAVTGSKRLPTLPDVPTLDELGFKGFDAQPWYGFLGPKGLPDDITKRMNEALQKALASPDVKSKLDSLGVQAMHMSPQQYHDFIQKDIVTWGAAVKASGAHVD
jgi:tripartite-type tricarboxylate transporter receptor subunit TctC